MIGRLLRVPAQATCSRRAQNYACQRWRRAARVALSAAGAAHGLLRQPEIQNLDPLIAGDEYVLRLEIAMYDSLSCAAASPLAICRTYSAICAVVTGSIHPLAECLTFQQFRYKVVNSVLHSDIVDSKKIGMIQRAQDPRFLLEPLQAVEIRRE